DQSTAPKLAAAVAGTAPANRSAIASAPEVPYILGHSDAELRRLMLQAEMVGPTGSVVGIDRSPAALALARDRARAAGHRGMTFHEAAAENYAGPAPFDFAIGRYVL